MRATRSSSLSSAPIGMTAVAPSFFATSSLLLARAKSSTTVRVAPIARATISEINPIGPAPKMTTRLPSRISARRPAYTPTANGSSSAPSSIVTWSGSLKQQSA
uniref:Putative secreted protein n=1 Tax=Anopheles darlingi TaxID=43151 RepID=A0A2M4D056_ANODA